MSVGFSYTPEKLQHAGISVYLFHWQDMKNPEIKMLLKNCRLMDKHIRDGHKLIVHCHAGQGRTALVIATYLMYSNVTHTVDETISFIRKSRPKCLKHKFNRTFLVEVEEELKLIRHIFPSKENKSKLSLKQTLAN